MGKVKGASWWTPEPAEPPLCDHTVGELLDLAVENHPDGDALVVSEFEDAGFDVRWSYRDLHERVDALARGLLSVGFRAGTHIAIWAPNVPEWVVVEFAAAKVGLVLVTINPTYRAEEAHYVLKDSGSQALFFFPRLRRLNLGEELAKFQNHLEMDYYWSLGEPVSSADTIESLYTRGKTVDPEDLAQRYSAVRSTDVVQIQYTSGTTGKPKGAMLTHHGIVNNARISAARWKIDHGDRWCNPMPLFHTAGCAMITLGLVSNSACQLLNVWFDADRALDTIQNERASITHLVPTMIIAMLKRNREQPRDLSSLRLVGSGGTPVPPELGQQIRNEWNTELRIVYGLTETSPLVTVTDVDDHTDRAIMTVGQPLPASEVQVTEQGLPTKTGIPGELLVRGYQVMKGYLGQPDATDKAITEQGWFRSGDLATMDDDGYIRIVGRAKDVIIRGGENLYPAEIEALIMEYPGIEEVAVVGVPDPYYGEEACAAIRASHSVDGDALRAWLSDRITHQKVPRYVVAVDAFPFTASGKIQKFRLQESVMTELGLPHGRD